MEEPLFDLEQYIIPIPEVSIEFVAAGSGLWLATCSNPETLRTLVDSEAQWLGYALVCERRYVEPLATALCLRGWSVTIDNEVFTVEEEE